MHAPENNVPGPSAENCFALMGAPSWRQGAPEMAHYTLLVDSISVYAAAVLGRAGWGQSDLGDGPGLRLMVRRYFAKCQSGTLFVTGVAGGGWLFLAHLSASKMAQDRERGFFAQRAPG